jgi:hypothetical protein
LKTEFKAKKTGQKWLIYLGGIERYIQYNINKYILACIGIWQCVSILYRMMNIDDTILMVVQFNNVNTSKSKSAGDLACPAIDYTCILKRKSNKKQLKNIYRILYLSIKFSVSVLVRCRHLQCNSMIKDGSDNGTNLN